MSDTRTTQTSFNGGIVSRALYGRKDLARVPVSLKRAENVLIYATGGAANRAGLRFVDKVKDSSKNVKLTTFEAAGDDAFLLVWGDLNVRPVFHGAYVDAGGGVPYEVVTPYPHEKIDELYMEQSNDIATIVHPDYPVRELARYAATDWRVSDVSFVTKVVPPSGITATATTGYGGYGEDKLPIAYKYKVAAISEDGEESLPSEAAIAGGNVMGYDKNYNTITWGYKGAAVSSSPSPTTRVLTYGGITTICPDFKLPNLLKVKRIGVHSATPRSFVVKIMRSDGGNSFTIMANQAFNHPGGGWADAELDVEYAIPATGEFYVAAYTAEKMDFYDVGNRFLNKARFAVNGDGGTGNYTSAVDNYLAMRAYVYDTVDDGPVTEFVIYRERNGIYGSIGRTSERTFKDDNIAPDFTETPQDGYNPFVGDGNYPGVVSFSQGRRVFSATKNKPQTIYETQSGNYRNMSRSTPSRESDSVEFTLAAERKQDINHILSVKNGLIVFTRSGEWKVTGRDGNVITPDNQLPEPQSRYGSSKELRPMLIGKNILFMDTTSKIVYDMEYSLEVDGYVATDKSLLVRDLFTSRKVKAWAYAAKPYGVIWCVMDDGSLLSLTYLKEHDVWGWCQHSTKGHFLDVAVVPENGRDVAYFVVERRVGGIWKKYIEFMEDRDFIEVESALFMDSALTYDQPFAITAVTPGAETVVTVPAHGWATGDEVDIRNTSFEDLDEKSQGSIDGRYTITVLTANTFKLWHKTIDQDWEVGDPLDSSDFVGLYYSPGVVRRCIQSVSGLDHLEGREVVVLADGFNIDNPQDNPIVVTGGSIPDFDRKYARIHVGLAYRSLIETLDLVNTQADDNGVMKATGPIYARFEQCRGVKVGQNEETAYELMPRDDEGYYSPPKLMSGIHEVENWGNWAQDIPMHFIQDYPLPMTVLGLTVEYVYGG